MTAPRVALLGPESAEVAEAAGVPGYFADVNLYRALLGHPELAKLVADLVVFLWRRSSLEGRLRELVIMRLAWLTGCEYEWAHHWPMALRAGLTEPELLALRGEWASDGFRDADAAVLAATDETILDGAVSDGTWRRLDELLGDTPRVLELLATISTWRTVSELVRSMGVPLEEGFNPWPPDGRAPHPIPAGTRAAQRERTAT